MDLNILPGNIDISLTTNGTKFSNIETITDAIVSSEIPKYPGSPERNSPVPQFNSVSEILVNNVKKDILSGAYIKYSKNNIFLDKNNVLQSKSVDSSLINEEKHRSNQILNKGTHKDLSDGQRKLRLSSRNNVPKPIGPLKKQDSKFLKTQEKILKKPKKIKSEKSGSETGICSDEPHSCSNDLFTGKNNDYCDACEQTGRFICCDACPKVFHFLCAEPPLDEKKAMELDHWFCRECSSTRAKSDSEFVLRDSSILEPLLEKLANSNPRTFSIPSEIRSEFSGIKSLSTGEYSESRKKTHKSSGNIERDFRQLVDENGELILCYRCDKTALHGIIIKCDFCELHWHWDCLTPPPSSLPISSQKWMCPNHGDELKTPNRRFKEEMFVNMSHFSHFAHNNGNIQVVDRDDGKLNSYNLNDPQIRFEIPQNHVEDAFINSADRRHLIETVANSIRKSNVSTKDWLKSVMTFQQQVANYLIKNPETDELAFDSQGLASDPLTTFASRAIKILCPSPRKPEKTPITGPPMYSQHGSESPETSPFNNPNRLLSSSPPSLQNRESSAESFNNSLNKDIEKSDVSDLSRKPPPTSSGNVSDMMYETLSSDSEARYCHEDLESSVQNSDLYDDASSSGVNIIESITKQILSDNSLSDFTRNV
ncbi:hypothetical protein AYI68_g4022 [Smittium mucronatum]|uniref:PHD-type domain-containing protein n=1 Tax=Smittium mucronatum TaxID=133383 RepID=A0A1R0GYF0_9FUNG|nr:hypothetical protein AYI68_g4022 [Smittium mucronatum]